MKHQKEKALELLEKLGADETQITEFRDNDSIGWSFPSFRDMLLCGFNGPEKIAEIEKKYYVLAYAAIYEEFPFGRTLNFLIVPDDPEEWDMLLNTDGDLHRVYAYVLNLTKEEFSEFGYITVKNDNGNLRRVL